jgi:hypothetical protein
MAAIDDEQASRVCGRPISAGYGTDASLELKEP